MLAACGTDTDSGLLLVSVQVASTFQHFPSKFDYLPVRSPACVPVYDCSEWQDDSPLVVLVVVVGAGRILLPVLL